MEMRSPSPVRCPHRVAAAVATVAVALLVTMPAAAVPTGWTGASRAYATHQAVVHDIAVETDGTTHIATDGGEAGGIWYVTRAGTTWEKTQVSTGDDHAPSIALDGTGVVIAFARKDAGQEGIYTVTNIDGDWAPPVLRHSGADANPSLAIFDGRAHIAFQAPGGELRYAAGPTDATDATGWVGQPVDGSCCTSAPSLALTAGGDPRVAYSDGPPGSPAGLAVSVRSAGGDWDRLPTVDSHKVSAPALAVYDDDLHIAYVRRGAGTWYASKVSKSWGFKQIDGGASGPPDLSAFSGSSAFIYGNTGKLKYATLSGGILLSRSFSKTAGDRNPRIVRAGGKPVVTWLRKNGGGSDGVLLSRQK